MIKLNISLYCTIVVLKEMVIGVFLIMYCFKILSYFCGAVFNFIATLKVQRGPCTLNTYTCAASPVIQVGPPSAGKCWLMHNYPKSITHIRVYFSCHTCCGYWQIDMCLPLKYGVVSFIALKHVCSGVHASSLSLATTGLFPWLSRFS